MAREDCLDAETLTWPGGLGLGGEGTIVHVEALAFEQVLRLSRE